MDTTEIQAKISALQEELDKLKANATIPYEVEQAFRTRLNIDTFTSLIASSKTAASETQLVNESGTQSYDVAKPMDGFRQVTIGGATIYIPYYNLV